MTKQELAQKIDLTLLRPDHTKEDIKKLCEDAKEYGFYAVCIPPYRVLDVVEYKEKAKGNFRICTVLDFPFSGGIAFYPNFLVDIPLNVDEVDIPLNISLFKDKKYDACVEVMKEIKKWNARVFVKGIIETSYLTDTEIGIAAKLVEQAGVNMVKANTGFGLRGVAPNDVEVIKKNCTIPIKVAGGIKTVEQVNTFLDLGVSRIGSSNGVEIVKDWNGGN